MHLLSFLTKIFIISLFLIHTCFPLRWDGTFSLHPHLLNYLLGNVLYDLESATLSALTAEAADWTISNYFTPGTKVSECGSTVLLGGYNILGGNGGATAANPYYRQYFQRTYTSLPTHNQIFLQLLFYSIDSWDGVCNSDTFTIEIDGSVVQGYCLYFWMTDASDICGVSIYADTAFTIYLALRHESSSLDLKIRNLSDEGASNESFGFRDLKIAFVSMGSPYFSLCQVGASYSSPNCLAACQNGQTVTPSHTGFCYPPSCSANCKTCSYSFTICTTCYSGSYLVDGICYVGCDEPLTTSVLGGVTYCETPCSGQYVWWDKSCSSVCSYTTSYGSYAIQGVVANTFLQCKYPCSTSEYLYWNSSCLNSCPELLITTVYKDRNFCEFPCGETQYLYWNGSCLSTCPSPLSPEVQGAVDQRKFCWYGCSETQYLYWNGSCIDKCDPPLSSEVQGTHEPRNFCWYPCLETQYLYWNGSCLSTCPSPLSPEVQGAVDQRKFCWYGCSETQYLYWNGSCTDKCDLPLGSEVQGIYEPRNFCWSPCQVDEYIYWNRSCSSECSFPLAEKIEPQIQFCQNPCGDFSTNYLYSNQSCFSTCPSPLSVINNPGVQYCVNLCLIGTYLYENKTCLSDCSSPYLKRTEPGVQYCDRPCSQPNIYWYQNASCLPECKFPYVQFNYSDIIECLPPCKDASEYFYDYEKKCFSSCESPYKIEIIDVIKVCKVGVSLPHEEVEKLKDTAASIQTQGKFTSGGMKAASAINSNSPSSALLAGLSSMMQYIRYMKINYPPKVQMLFLVSADSPISLGFDFNIPSFIEEHLVDEPLPDAFEKYDINSNFVSNLWDFMVSLALILVVILVLVILKMVTIGFPRINVIVTRVLQLLKWNFPIMMVCGSSADIFFFATLQLRSSPFTNLSSTICCIVSILMMILVTLLLAIAFKIVYVIHKRAQNSAQETPSEADKWKGLEILYVEYEEKSFFSLAYMFLFMSRGIVFNLTLAILFDYPIVQCIIINVCNIAMICYIFYLRPLKNLLALVQLWINEGLVNTLSISVLILGILDKMSVNREATRVGVGNVILFAIKTFNTAGLVFMGIAILMFIISMLRTLRTLLNKKKRKSPLQIIKALVFGAPESEKVSPGLEKFSKKPLQKEKSWSGEDHSSMIYTKEDSKRIHLVSERSLQTTISHEPINRLQTELKEDQVTDFDISQSFCIPQRREPVKRRIFFDEMKGKDEALVRVCEVKVQRTKDILESSKEEEGGGLEKRSDEEETRLWYSKLRKLKRRLNKSSKKIDLAIETNHSLQ